MSGLRFCMVTTFYPPYNFGGDGIAIQRLSRALADRGHQVTVVHDLDAYDMLSDRPDPPPTQKQAAEGLEVVGLRSGRDGHGTGVAAAPGGRARCCACGPEDWQCSSKLFGCLVCEPSRDSSGRLGWRGEIQLRTPVRWMTMRAMPA